MKKQIAVLIGSNSKTSFSRLVFQYLNLIATDNIQLNVVEIADLPLYDRDFDTNNPASYDRVRAQIAQSDAVLFITPEHNGAIPAMIKNVIDVVSRPMGESKWIGKAAGIVSVGAGLAGGVSATTQLRSILANKFVSMPTAPFAANVGGLFNGIFNEQGELVSEPTKAMLQEFMTSYVAFIEKFA